MMTPIQVRFTKTAKRTFQAIQKGYPVIVNEGGARCFHPNQLICTPNGSVPISSLTPGSEVLSIGGNPQEVSDVIKTENRKSCVKVRLKNGKEIICTEDHRFFFSGRWMEIKDILSLWDVYSKKL